MRKNPQGELIPAFDLTPATAYGELITLLPRGPGVMLNANVVTAQLRNKLKDFSDDDFILPVGSMSAVLLVGMVVAEFNRGRAKALTWNRNAQAYQIEQLDKNAIPL